MSYVLVTADFPGVTAHQRNEIYACLESKSWKKIHENGRDMDTVWETYFRDGMPESEAVQVAIKEFTVCSASHCKPKLVVHWGPSKPTSYGLDQSKELDERKVRG